MMGSEFSSKTIENTVLNTEQIKQGLYEGVKKLCIEFALNLLIIKNSSSTIWTVLKSAIYTEKKL